MKFLKLVALIPLICSFVFADGENEQSKNKPRLVQVVVGAFGGLGFAQGDYEYYKDGWEVDLLDRKYLNSLASYGGKIGADFNFTKNHGMRIYADFVKMDQITNKDQMAKNLSLMSYGLNAEYRYTFDFNLGLFAGAGLAYSAGKSNLINDISHFGAAFNAGITYSFAKFLELELRGKFIVNELINRMAVPDSLLPANQANAGIYELDYPAMITIGLNFRF